MDGQARQLVIEVLRYRPSEPDNAPRLQQYHIEETDNMTLYLALSEIREQQDPSLQFDFVCRAGICGSCAMNVNGRNILVCHEPLMKHLDGGGRVTIRPLPYLPIIKDLVVDRSAFDRIIEAGGYISVDTGGTPDANLIPVPKEAAEAAHFGGPVWTPAEDGTSRFHL